MHEFAVATEMVEIAAEQARRAGAQRVSHVHCRIGALCHIDERVLRDAFALAAEETVCAGAAVLVERAPMVAACTACGNQFPVANWSWLCPKCGGQGRRESGGDELEMLSIDVEVDDEHTRGAQDPVTQPAGR